MGGLYGRKKGSRVKDKKLHRDHKTKHYKKDIDLIYEDVKPENQQKYLNQPLNEELPGLGQYFCISCSRYFQSKSAIDHHNTTKKHKKRLKVLKEVPYTIKDSEEFGKF